jgi:PAS domain S-box-containing protein
VSRNIERYGYRVEDMFANPVRYLELIHPDDRIEVVDDIVRIIDGRLAEATRDIRIMAAEGHYVWFECHITPVRGKDNRITEIEGIAIDIDRRNPTSPASRARTN